MMVRPAFAALLLCAGGPAFAQESADSLVAKNLAARGGEAAIASIKSLRFDGRVIFPGDFELTYKETRSSADQSRIEMTLQGLSLVQGYDGRTAWRINPFQGRRDAERMSADEARAVADSALVEGPLLAARKDGSRVAYLGREDFDGTNAYKLKVSQKDGDEFTYLLDPDTFLEIKITESRKIRGAPQISETELGDYEKIGGVYFPMSVESWQEGQPNQRQRLVIASGEANVATSAAMFAEPRTPGGPSAAEPPDASNAPKGEVQKAPNEPPSQPPTDAANPPSPPKGE